MTGSPSSGLVWAVAIATVVAVTPVSAQPPASAGKPAAAPAAAPTPPAPKIDEVEKGTELFRQGKLDEALVSFEQAVKKHPELPPAPLLLAKLCATNPPVAQNVRPLVEKAATDAPDHPEVYLFNGSLALAEGRLSDAILNGQRALELAQKDRWSGDRRQIYIRAAHAGLAKVYEARKEWGRAREHLTAWLAIEPANAPARQQLGQVLFLLGRGDDGYAELVRASKEDPALDPPELILGKLGQQTGNKAVTTDWMGKALAKHGEDPRVQLALANWKVQQGKPAEARSHIDAALRLDAKSREALFLRGVVARLEKKPAEAEKVFEALHRDYPGDFVLANQLALSLADQDDSKQKQRAVELAEVNARQYQRSPDAAATLGWAYLRANRLDDADKALGMFATGGHNISPDTAYYMARIMYERGNKDKAHDLLEAALKLEAPFAYRDEATKLLAELPKKPATPDKPAAKPPE